MQEWAKIVPPPTLGTPPAPAAPGEEEPFEEALVNKMLGVMYLPEPNTDPSLINGTPASPGTVQGIAKVVRSLNEASKLQPRRHHGLRDDHAPLDAPVQHRQPASSPIQAASSRTAPSSPASTACPAVVGTLMGTSVIQDGWTITVDGTKGVVRIDKRG